MSPTGLLLCVLLMWSWPNVQATTVVPYALTDLQALAQSSDAVISATIDSVIRGERGHPLEDGSYFRGTETLVNSRVKVVHFGPPDLAGKELEFRFTSADSPISTSSPEPLLLFLQKDGATYRLTFARMYGVMPVVDGSVQAWFEGRPYGSFYLLQELLTLIKSYREAQIELKTAVATTHAISANVLPVQFTFKNIGHVSVLILPPSYTFNSLQSCKLTGGQWFPKENPCCSVGQWDFIEGELEPLVKLPAGGEHTFLYKIPYKILGINGPGQYTIFYGNPLAQPSKWALKAKLGPEILQETWLGTNGRGTQVIQILPTKGK